MPQKTLHRNIAENKKKRGKQSEIWNKNLIKRFGFIILFANIDNDSRLANGCYLKAAAFAAQLEQYDLAIQHFEGAATTSLGNNLTKFSVKDYLLKAGLCQLCRGVKMKRENWR